MWYSFKRIEYQSVRKVIVLFLDFQLVAKKTGRPKSSRSRLEYVQRL